MKNLVSTGTFSKVCRLSVRVLRHYDELGLLRPIVDDASGYRYYTLAQAAEANLIRRLRELNRTVESKNDWLATEGF
jgi:DNA-binding transcriptional MerR regulator